MESSFLGLLKKIVFADWLGYYVDQIFRQGNFDSPWAFLLAINAFSFQIYLDFSAYSDIAIGLGKILGVDIRENFKWPYLAQNIAAFWRRWHISLRDYLYKPLGGSWFGKWKTIRNIFVVMLLGSLWHGATSTFFVWGLWNACILALYVAAKPMPESGVFQMIPQKFWQVGGVFATYSLGLGGRVFFRSASLDQALQGFSTLNTDWTNFDLGTDQETAFRTLCVFGIAVFAHVARGLGWVRPPQNPIAPIAVAGFIAAAILLIALFHAPTGMRFYYFQF